MYENIRKRSKCPNFSVSNLLINYTLIADKRLCLLNIREIDFLEVTFFTGTYKLLRRLVFDPWPLSKTEVHLKISEHKILCFLVRKEIIENNNSLVVILLSKVEENDFLQTL